MRFERWQPEASSVGVIQALWAILAPAARRRLLILVVLTTVAGFVEIVSVSLVIPFIAVAANSMPFGRASWLAKGLTDLVQAMGFAPEQTTLGLGLVFLAGLISANSYLCFFQFYAARTIALQKNDLSNRVLRCITRRPLEWMDNENTAALIKVSLDDVSHVSSVTDAMAQITAVLARCLILYLFFLYLNPHLALLLAFSMSLAYVTVFRTVQRALAAAGVQAQNAMEKMFRCASELLSGFREARATNSEPAFLARFQAASNGAIHPETLRSMPPYLTRSGLETVTMATVIALLIYFKQKDGNLDNGLPLLSAYAVAGIRLLPAVQQGLSYYLMITYLKPSLRMVQSLLTLASDSAHEENLQPQPLAFEREIALQGVTYTFPNGKVALTDVDLRICRGNRVALVGATGAGKSTLMDLLLGLRLPARGQLLVDGTSVDATNARAWRQHIGYVPQRIFLLDGTVAENVAYGLSPEEVNREQVERACRSASIHDFILTLPGGYDTPVGERGVLLSGGQCQRIGIARALYHDPQVLVFDEATSALDNATEQAILETLDRLKNAKTLLVIAHRLNTVWDFDELVVLSEGRVVARGTARELLETSPDFQLLAQHRMSSAAEN